MNKELKPCPFCNALPSLVNTEIDMNEYWAVVCVNCGARIECADFYRVNPKEEVIEVWNRRA